MLFAEKIDPPEPLEPSEAVVLSASNKIANGETKISVGADSLAR
jgi:hypothetical protein